MINDIIPMKHNTRIAVFIENLNFYSTICELGFRVNYHKLLDWLTDEGEMEAAKVVFYTNSQHNMGFLKHLGYEVDRSQTYTYNDKRTGKEVLNEQNTAVRMSVHAMSCVDKADYFVFFTGRKCFDVLYEELQRRGKKVVVVSSRTAPSKPLALRISELADHIIELSDIRKDIEL